MFSVFEWLLLLKSLYLIYIKNVDNESTPDYNNPRRTPGYIYLDQHTPLYLFHCGCRRLSLIFHITATRHDVYTTQVLANIYLTKPNYCHGSYLRFWYVSRMSVCSAIRPRCDQSEAKQTNKQTNKRNNQNTGKHQNLYTFVINNNHTVIIIIINCN